MKYIFLVLAIAAILLVQNNVYATGGGKDIASLIQPMIDRALKYMQEGNTDAAMEELENVQNELKDTFELED